MTEHIDAILFDMGGTLRGFKKSDPATMRKQVEKIIELVAVDYSVNEFTKQLKDRAKAYSLWARETLIELDEKQLWTKWMLPDLPEEKIIPIAIELNQLWRKATGTRDFFPESRDVLIELFRRGYRLGLVSNTVTSVEIPQAFREMNIAGIFETVILSCDVGMRKPDPAILLEATDRMSISPEKCVYIGNAFDRDVVSSRQAGFSKVILLRDQTNPDGQVLDDNVEQPDINIDSLNELLDIFKPKVETPKAEVSYNTSISTMWGIKNFPKLSDFFEAARRLGFGEIEINHRVNSSMLEGIDFSQFKFSSVHEPCPADISTGDLKDRGWLISSDDEEKRKKGVEAAKRSIDLAHKIGAKVLVTHCGMVFGLTEYENRLRDMLLIEENDTDEFQMIVKQMIKQREDIIEPHFQAVKRSVLELMEYAGRFNIIVGLENRYHQYDIPNLDEMEELLSLGSPEQLGFIYDVGHAETLDNLGFFPHEEWLRRYSSRLIGTHLHDVIGADDHYSPGLGNVDYEMIKSYLTDAKYRAFEVQNWNSYQQVRSGLKFLAKKGLINQTK